MVRPPLAERVLQVPAPMVVQRQVLGPVRVRVLVLMPARVRVSGPAQVSLPMPEQLARVARVADRRTRPRRAGRREAASPRRMAVLMMDLMMDLMVELQ